VLYGSGPSAPGQLPRAFFGVGSAPATDRSAQRNAENRARSEVAKTLEIYRTVLAKGCIDADPAAPQARPHDESRAEWVVASYRLDGSGTQLREHWTGPDGTLYVRAVLELETMKAVAQRRARIRRLRRASVRTGQQPDPHVRRA
jgi:hypothetical protein